MDGGRTEKEGKALHGDGSRIWWRRSCHFLLDRSHHIQALNSNTMAGFERYESLGPWLEIICIAWQWHLTRSCRHTIIPLRANIDAEQGIMNDSYWPVALLQQFSARWVSTVRERQLCTDAGHTDSGCCRRSSSRRRHLAFAAILIASVCQTSHDASMLQTG